MEYQIIEGAENIRLEDVVRLLRLSYWADRRPAETIETSVKNSACYGVRIEGEDRLVGFARVISDNATTWYLCDVIIDPEYRGRGLGTALVSHIVSRYRALRGLLVTRDAQELYRRFGFEVQSGRTMARDPDKEACEREE